MERDINPDVLSALEETRSFMESTSTRTGRRVKIDKNERWTVRFLPIEQGLKKHFWGTIAFHWIGKRPYYCPRVTPSFMGGDKTYNCPICNEVEELNKSSDRVVSSTAFRASANIQYLLYCLVFSKKNAGGLTDKTRGDDRWKAWEFPMNRNHFSKLLTIYEKSLKRTDMGIFDLYKGKDIDVDCDNRMNLNFTADETMPIYEPKDDQGNLDTTEFQRVVDSIWNTVHLPNLVPPSEDDADAAIEKLREIISFTRRKKASERQGSDDFDDDLPSSRSRGMDNDRDDRGCGDDRSRGDRNADDSDREDDDRPRKAKSEDDDDLDMGDRRSQRESRPTATRPSPPPARSLSESIQNNRPPRTVTPPPPSVRPPREEPVARAVSPPPAAASPRTPPPATRTPTAKSSPVQTDIDDNDNVTDESKDLAEPEDPAAIDKEEEAPPPVQAKGGLSDRLRRGIARSRERED